jgi:hypothetical protein
MDIAADMELHTEIFHGGVRRAPGVTVTLDKDWFRMHKLRAKKPSAISVKRYWALLKQPLDAMTALPTLYMIRKAMLDWPRMGAAIAKLAHKEFEVAKQISKLQKRRTMNVARKMLKESPLVANLAGKDDCSARPNNSDKKTSAIVLRNAKKINKK